MDFITTDIRIQQLILSLDDNSLNLFSKMYEKLIKKLAMQFLIYQEFLV